MNVQEAIDALPTTEAGIADFLILNGYSGVPEHPDKCPLANYLKMTTGRRICVTNAIVYDDTDWYRTYVERAEGVGRGVVQSTTYETTEAMHEFIQAFDQHAYLDLIEDHS